MCLDTPHNRKYCPILHKHLESRLIYVHLTPQMWVISPVHLKHYREKGRPLHKKLWKWFDRPCVWANQMSSLLVEQASTNARLPIDAGDDVWLPAMIQHSFSQDSCQSYSEEKKSFQCSFVLLKRKCCPPSPINLSTLLHAGYGRHGLQTSVFCHD